MDVHLLQPMLLDRDPEDSFGVDPQEFPDLPDAQRPVAEQSSYNDFTQVQTMRWRFADSSSEQAAGLEFSLRCIFPQELKLLLESNEFEIRHSWGDFDQKPFSSDDLKQVIVARKSEVAAQ